MADCSSTWPEDRRCRFAVMYLELGGRQFDITARVLVLGILNRTPDSFFDQGSYFDFDQFLHKADALVRDGADILDVGGVKAGPGPDVGEQEELDRVLPAITALHVAPLGLTIRTVRSRGYLLE